MNCPRFGQIIVRGSCAVQINILYFRGLQSRRRKGLSHGAESAVTIGVWRCGVIGIAAQANAKNLGKRPCRRLRGSL